MRVGSVETWTLRLPLTTPVEFGSMRFTERDYAILRVRDEDGASGFAYCLGRGAGLASAASRLAAHVLGTRVGLSEQVWHTLYEATIPYGQRGVALRALSLIDIALWDLRARRARLPLYEMFGAFREEMDAWVGGGYHRGKRDPDDISEELGDYVKRGFPLVKVPGGGRDPASEEEWLAFVRDAVGSGVNVAVDAHWSWRDVWSARSVLGRWDEYGLAFVEDPLWPEAVHAAAELRRSVQTPIAIGDEQSGRWAYVNLREAGAADLWRVDATTVGGFTEFRRIAALASAWGVAISTHIYPELHVHVAAAEPAVAGVEYVDPQTEIDLAHRFISDPLEPAEGVLTAPTEPGLGFDLDWDMIESSASEAFRT